VDLLDASSVSALSARPKGGGFATDLFDKLVVVHLVGASGGAVTARETAPKFQVPGDAVFLSEGGPPQGFAGIVIRPFPGYGADAGTLAALVARVRAGLFQNGPKIKRLFRLT